MNNKNKEIFDRSMQILERYNVIEINNEGFVSLSPMPLNDVALINQYLIGVCNGEIPELDGLHDLIGEYVESLVYMRALLYALFNIKGMPKYMDEEETYNIKGAMVGYINCICAEHKEEK